jgi:PAS domain-containing protein
MHMPCPEARPHTGEERLSELQHRPHVQVHHSRKRFNPRWLEYAGFTADQARGLGWTTALHPDDAKGLLDYSQELLVAGHAGECEARLRRFDGEYH